MLLLLIAAVAQGQQKVGADFTATGQYLRPVGTHITIEGRPVDVALSGDGKYAIVKENRGVTVIRTQDWSVTQSIKVSGGASLHGILATPQGDVVFTDAASGVHFGKLSLDGKVSWGATVQLPKPKIGGEAYPCGMDFDSRGRLVVAVSRSNAIAIIEDGKVVKQIPVGPAPFDVKVTTDGKRAVVTCWGRKPTKYKSESSGTDVDIDERGVATGGELWIVDLDPSSQARKPATPIPLGLQPSEIALTNRYAYIANANSDTVSVIDLMTRKRLRDVIVKPDPGLPFGSAPNALALSEDEGELYVACGGNNAVAVLSLRNPAEPQITGWLPTNWYPGALAQRDGNLYIASIKGTGSRSWKERGKFNTHQHSGTITRTQLPTPKKLSELTKQVLRLSYAPLILKNMERRGNAGAKPVPVPKRLGDPSVFENIVYILKENRTYDQMFGDIPRGDGAPGLTLYGRRVSPNHHALADQFVLLDNYYCNGVLSADGHAWSMEANASSFQEKSFGGWTRSYPFGGDDALAVSMTGFIWDDVLASGLSFRNYGEFDNAEPEKKMSFKQIYDAYVRGEQVKFKQNMSVAKLRRYSNRDYPGWNMGIPDVLRASVFLKEFKEFERKGVFPNFTVVYLPQDHTSGLAAGMPTPEAHVADNDLALGRIVEAITKSKFWKKTVIFVIEDDPQNGFDHVDGHRSICLVISPYSQRKGKVVSEFYNQTSVIHTMRRMMGLPPMNQNDAHSPVMSTAFTSKPNYASYKVRPNNIPLDKLNPAPNAQYPIPNTRAAYWARRSLEINLSIPDAGKDDLFNKILWFAAYPNRPYPAKWAGPHGRGLKKKGLSLEKGAVGDD